MMEIMTISRLPNGHRKLLLLLKISKFGINATNKVRFLLFVHVASDFKIQYIL